MSSATRRLIFARILSELGCADCQMTVVVRACYINWLTLDRV
jgi:hypothetical protein